MAGPPPSVLHRFGLTGPVQQLESDQGDTFRVGEAVLKRSGDDDEAGWIQQLQADLRPDGFRIAEPILATDGRWVADGWTAAAFVDGLAPAAPDWELIAAIGERFTDAADLAAPADTGPLDRRTHRWAVADRVAWDEQTAGLAPPADEILRRLRDLARSPDRSGHVVHADLSGNVFLDPSGTPVVLDVSPARRARGWGRAIVVADATTWLGAPLDLAAEHAAAGATRDLLGRALIFRLVAEQLDPVGADPATLAPYVRLLDALG